MYPLPSNPTVRVWREKSTGRIMQVDSNIAPELKVEVVDVADGECIARVDEKIEGSYPFGNRIVGPTPRNLVKPSIGELLNS
jgi:hypothetical protein